MSGANAVGATSTTEAVVPVANGTGTIAAAEGELGAVGAGATAATGGLASGREAVSTECSFTMGGAVSAGETATGGAGVTAVAEMETGGAAPEIGACDSPAS
jgi:hypothetical protein